MRLHFTKMHGLGNDFAVFDGITQNVDLTAGQIRRIADRHFGIGCDQVLLVEPPGTEEVDFRYRIFNADGNEVEQCGNGARCFARFVRDRGLTRKDQIRVQTAAGIIRLVVQADNQITVDMGIPRLAPADIPFEAQTQALQYSIEAAGRPLQIGAVSMGNPHAVLAVEDVDSAPVVSLGQILAHHPRFPKRTNVGFMQILDPGHIRLRVFERGVGETLACGSGACAAVVAGRLWDRLGESVQVDLPGGSLRICWTGRDTPVIMTGSASRVFEGWIDL